MIKFCCEDMKIHALEKDDTDKYIYFDLSERCFGIFQKNEKYAIAIKHCPFCGTKLPIPLIDEKWDTILEELGKDYVSDDEGNPPKKRLPKEFQTDEWWKKRGL